MRWRSVGLITIASAFIPLRVYLTNIDKFPHPERLLVVILAYLAVALLWRWALTAMRIGSMASTASAFALAFLLSSAGEVALVVSTLAALALAFVVSIILAVLLNRRTDDLTHSLVSGVSALLCVMLVVVWLQNSDGEDHDSPIVVPSEPIDVNFRNHPDIFLILLDGFPGERAITDVYESRLEISEPVGVVRNQVWAAYPMTIASVSSIFNMNYPLRDGSVLDASTSGELARIMSGDNVFMDLVRKEGYKTTVVESGYSRSFCSENVDVCVSSSFLDEATFEVLRKSLFARLLTETRGSGFTVGGLRTMRWLRETLPRLAGNGEPDFVFASVLAPHPPLFLGETCEFVYEYWRSGNSVFGGDWLIDRRQQAFLSQARCVADFENQLFDAIAGDAVLIFLSDHGGDSLGQMAKENHVWSRPEIIERLNAHLAMRIPGDCRFQPIMLTDVLRGLSLCLAGVRQPDLTHRPRMFTAGRIPHTPEYILREVAQDTVSELLNGTTARD